MNEHTGDRLGKPGRERTRYRTGARSGALLCLVLFAIVPLARGAEPYVATDGGWTVEVPDGWVVDTSGAPFIEFRTVNRRAPAVVGIQAGIGPDESFDIVATLTFGGWRRALEAGGGTLRLESRTRRRLAGGQLAIEYRATLSEAQISAARVIVVQLGETIVILTAEAGVAGWRLHGEAIDALLGSFRSTVATPALSE